MSETLGELLALQKQAKNPTTIEQQLNVPALPEYPDVEEARHALQEIVERAKAEVETAQRNLQEKIGQSLSRIVPERLLAMEQEHGFSESFYGALETYERFGLLEGKAKKGMLMSPKEVRDSAPNIGDVLDALKDHPELLVKVEQGFAKVHPVPFGLSPAFLKEGMGKAIAEYHEQGKLRFRDGTKLELNTSEPVQGHCNEGADKSGKLVYFPERFDPENHGGKTKKEILEASKFPGWQVFLIENLRDIIYQWMSKGNDRRPHIKLSGYAPEEYLALLQDGNHANEQGLTLESWQTMFLRRLEETDGEVLDSEASCYCIGAYFPSYDAISYARSYSSHVWLRDIPIFRNPDAGTRFGVRVL